MDNLNIYDWNYGGHDLAELKTWVDTAIAEEKTKVKVNIDWGWYNDIDGLELEAL